MRIFLLKPKDIKRSPSSGPGTLLSHLIFKITGIPPCNNCNKRIQQMNQWGYTGCLRNKETILDWLTEEARKRGRNIERPTLQSLLLSALKEMHK